MKNFDLPIALDNPTDYLEGRGDLMAGVTVGDIAGDDDVFSGNRAQPRTFNRLLSGELYKSTPMMSTRPGAEDFLLIPSRGYST